MSEPKKRRVLRPVPDVELKLWPGSTGDTYVFEPRLRDPAVLHRTSRLPRIVELYFLEALLRIADRVDEELADLDSLGSSTDQIGGEGARDSSSEDEGERPP